MIAGDAFSFGFLKMKNHWFCLPQFCENETLREILWEGIFSIQFYAEFQRCQTWWSSLHCGRQFMLQLDGAYHVSPLAAGHALSSAPSMLQ